MQLLDFYASLPNTSVESILLRSFAKVDSTFAATGAHGDHTSDPPFKQRV